MRVVKSYLCYANLDIFQPESIMSKLQVEDYVKPIPIEFKDGGNRKRAAWTTPVDEALEWQANKELEAKSFVHDNLKRAHVILAGDHGQGAFRMMVMLLLITRRNRRRPNSTTNFCVGTELALEVDAQAGYVQCKKDAHQVLEETIAVPVDAALDRIRRSGKVTVYQTPDGDVKMCFGGVHTAQGVELSSAPIETVMTGDLAFYSMVLGKVNMAGHWCWRCSMTKSECAMP